MEPIQGADVMVEEYIHRDLNQEIQAIGGTYIVSDEIRLTLNGGEVFYLKGYALMDTSCCGMAGCPFVHVKGKVVAWKKRKNHQGLEVSFVEPIEDEELKRMIEEILQEKELYHQIRFD
jgi:hypothetical protein